MNNTSQKYLDSTKMVGRGYKRVEDENYGINSPNDVVLLFSHVNPKALMCFGSDDCGVQSQKNRLESITSYANGGFGSFDFDTVEETIKKCMLRGSDTTEYVFLFEDEEGKKIKPSAVRVMGENPSIYEIQAAQKLGVPLIKLEVALEQEIDENVHEEGEIGKPSQKVLEVFSKLNQNISKIIEKMPNIQKSKEGIEK